MEGVASDLDLMQTDGIHPLAEVQSRLLTMSGVFLVLSSNDGALIVAVVPALILNSARELGALLFF